ncbi:MULTISPECIES: hypothetical protein [unclassified Acinetobacter]|uniref:hypothetical protein n=1 Tax=unclassified Acinetobacter TaxID=196816 RepID=UPI002578BE96|nr:MULTISPECIES: hypothetical protein [unclassified Acinetobacter]MDM1757747.1 hypothetical protein [Acinetobacter sp. 256-1]MDM1761843.1 hypothetical protein [Acinetobacter sp. 251-1]
MLKQVVKIFLVLIVGVVHAQVIDYDLLKEQAIEYENSLTEQEKSQLNRSYAEPLSVSIGFCAQFYQGTSFEIVSRVSERGVLLENWTNTIGPFAECVRSMFNHQHIYSVRNEAFYAFLEFNLTKQ